MAEPSPSQIVLLVVGAHLTGQPLNHQLTDLGATFLREAHTAACYRFYALDTTPPKPGLVRVHHTDHGAASLEGEMWSLSTAAFGQLVDAVPSPLVIGRVRLRPNGTSRTAGGADTARGNNEVDEVDEGAWVAGFLCEPIALEGATDITAFGGWRAYLARGKRTGTMSA